VKANHQEYNINPDLIALGGFSAGGITSINVAYALKEEVAAVITTSGIYSGFELQLMTAKAPMPPLQIFMAQTDLPFIAGVWFLL